MTSAGDRIFSRPRAPSLDVGALRAQFPALHQEVRGHPLVYLDNAASTHKPRAVLEAIEHYYAHEYSNVHRGVHWLSERVTLAYEGAREKVSAFINARPSEVVFVRGTTEAINLVAQTYGRVYLKPGDEILITAMEHHSNIVPWQLLCEQTGACLKVAPINERGEIVLEQFEKLINPRTRLVAVVHVSNSLGTINPVQWIVDRAHTFGARVLVDGAQAVAHLPVDVQALGCDFYAFSGHKLFGPTGIGVLYGKAELLRDMPPYQGGGEMIRQVSFERSTYADPPHRFEAGTPHIVGAIGLGAAVDFVQSVGLDTLAAHEHELLMKATTELDQIPGLRIIGTAQRKAAIVSFVIDGIHAHDIGTILDSQGIAVRVGHHCTMPLMQRYGVAATARAAFAGYNSLDEVDALVAGIRKVKEVFG